MPLMGVTLFELGRCRMEMRYRDGKSRPRGTGILTRMGFGSALLTDLPSTVDFSFPVISESVAAATKVLRVMAERKRETGEGGHIKLFIHSPGGSVTEGLKFLTVIRHLGVGVDTVILGQAASMGAVVALLGAAKGRKFMDRYAKIMVHQPSAAELSGNSQEVMEIARHMSKTRNTLDSLISQHTGQPLEVIRELTAQDTYISPLQALKLGFVDWVLISGEKGLNRQSIQKLSDKELAHRDEYNLYDDLAQFEFDPLVGEAALPVLYKTSQQSPDSRDDQRGLKALPNRIWKQLPVPSQNRQLPYEVADELGTVPSSGWVGKKPIEMVARFQPYMA